MCMRIEMSKQNGPTYQYLFSCWSIYSQSLVLPCLPRLYIKLKGFFCGTARLDSSFNKKGPQSQIYDLVVPFCSIYLLIRGEHSNCMTLASPTTCMLGVAGHQCRNVQELFDVVGK